MPDTESTALKEIFNEARYRTWAKELRTVYPTFDSKRFLKIVLDGLGARSLLERLRRTTEALRETLPADFPKAVALLRRFAPRIGEGFPGLVWSDYVALYGQEHYDLSMEALAYFTRFGSAEFAIREFLKRDLKKTLAVMRHWAESPDEHVRRLSSEGCRPRLPWSFRLTEIDRNPELTEPILAQLLRDPSLYVRKSVANHLNDFSKNHPEWLVAWLAKQDLTHPHARWIAKRALRTLIKAGHTAALELVGATGKAALKVERFEVSPKRLRLGQPIEIALEFTATGKEKQHLVIDYAIHYVKSNGKSAAKVFKWKALDIAPKETVQFLRKQRIQDFTTRKHHPGKHVVDVRANGQIIAEAAFVLSR